MVTVDSKNAIWLSIQVGLWCTVIGLPFAIALGWFLARYRGRGKAFIDLLVFSPLVVPPVVTGYLLLEVFGRGSVLGHWLDLLGMSVSFTFGGAVIASLIVGFPFYVMGVRAAFEAVDPRLEELAWTLGSSPIKTFFRVSLPLAFPGVVAGAVLAFARALGEFGATVVIAGNMEGKTRTIALAVYTLLESPEGMNQVRPLVLSSLAISFVALLAYELLIRWHRKRLEWRNGE